MTGLRRKENGDTKIVNEKVEKDKNIQVPMVISPRIEALHKKHRKVNNYQYAKQDVLVNFFLNVTYR